MDLLYVLGSGTAWQDNELRYSLRSACRHLPHGKVVVVGERPTWLTGITHIPAQDRYPFPVRNTLHKLNVAIDSGLLADRFVLMNDDFLLLRPFDPTAPAVVSGTLQQRITAGPVGADPHYHLLKEHLPKLRALGIPEPLDYDLHHPLPMDTTAVAHMLATCGGSGHLYPWRTYYGNLAKVPAVLGVDVKMRVHFRMPHHAQAAMSFDDGVATDVGFQAWCGVRWPLASPYEVLVGT